MIIHCHSMFIASTNKTNIIFDNSDSFIPFFSHTILNISFDTSFLLFCFFFFLLFLFYPSFFLKNETMYTISKNKPTKKKRTKQQKEENNEKTKSTNHQKPSPRSCNTVQIRSNKKQKKKKKNIPHALELEFFLIFLPIFITPLFTLYTLHFVDTLCSIPSI